MLWLDLKHAVDKSGNNFTVLLFQLMLKADAMNLDRLFRSYPVEAEMVRLFHDDCSYINEERTEVDWELIEERAKHSIGDWS